MPQEQFKNNGFYEGIKANEEKGKLSSNSIFDRAFGLLANYFSDEGSDQLVSLRMSLKSWAPMQAKNK